MAAKRPASVSTIVAEKFQHNWECRICTEVKEFRMLPCQHRLCKDCLDRILSLTGGSRCCPFCKTPLSKRRAVDYQICRLTASLQEDISQLTYDLINNEKEMRICSSAGCDRPVDMYCTQCALYMCFQCSKSKCVETGSHDLKEYDEEKEMLKKAKLESWESEKRRKIDSITKERSKLVDAVRRKVISASEGNVLHAIDEASKLKVQIEQLDESKRQIEEEALEECDKDEGSIESLDLQDQDIETFDLSDQDLDFDDDDIEDPEDDVATLVDNLSLIGDRRNSITLGECEYMETPFCYAVVVSRQSGVLVGQSQGYRMYTNGGEARRSVQISKMSEMRNVVSLQQYNHCIYALCKEPKLGIHREVIVYDDRRYEKVRSWSVPNYSQISQIAICDDKVYVPDPHRQQLSVYSTLSNSDVQVSSVSHPSFITPAFLSVSPPHSILISDPHAHKVHRLDCMSDKISWSCSVVKSPVAVCCDNNSNAWVWSHESKSFYILHTETGEIKQSVSLRMDTLAKDFDVYGMCIKDNTLWMAAHGNGLLKCDIIR